MYTQHTGVYKGGFKCKWCDHPVLYVTGKSLRHHTHRKHPEVPAIELERYLVQTRYPDMDIDFVIDKYKNRLETMIGLQKKGVFIKKYMQTLGIIRHYNADRSLMRFIKEDMQTEAEVKKAMEDALVGKFRNASPEVRFKGYMNRDAKKLENNGLGELVPAYKALKIINYAKNKLQEEIKNKTEEASSPGDSPDTD